MSSFVQIKEEKQAKRAKLASKSKLSFADEEEEDEVGQTSTPTLMLVCQFFASKAGAACIDDQPLRACCMHAFVSLEHVS